VRDLGIRQLAHDNASRDKMTFLEKENALLLMYIIQIEAAILQIQTYLQASDTMQAEFDMQKVNHYHEKVKLSFEYGVESSIILKSKTMRIRQDLQDHVYHEPPLLRFDNALSCLGQRTTAAVYERHK